MFNESEKILSPATLVQRLEIGKELMGDDDAECYPQMMWIPEKFEMQLNAELSAKKEEELIPYLQYFFTETDEGKHG